jgi:putative ABC transport system substrate-binding protein
VIGYLSFTKKGEPSELLVRQGLGKEGYVEGRNLEIFPRFAELQYDRLPALAADLVHRRVAVIVALGAPAAKAAMDATATIPIPIVFLLGVDPVESGLVASLSRPSGNLTGVTLLAVELNGKRLELLHETVPMVKSFGILIDPAAVGFAATTREAENAARILRVGLTILAAKTPSEIERAFAGLAERGIGALHVAASSAFLPQRDQLIALAARHAVPAIYASREIVQAGGLMSYGTNGADASRLVGAYAGRILKGEKPANLPVERSTRTELVINLKTAKALGLIIPETLLATADEVIQ